MKEFLSQLAANDKIEPGAFTNYVNNDDSVGESGMTTLGLFGSEDSLVTTIINIILYVVGIVAVVMLVIGGIKYATSSGDEKKVTSAKNTIIYALLGLAFAILAWTLVNFVFSNLGQ
jgi:hypothetical protein